MAPRSFWFAFRRAGAIAALVSSAALPPRGTAGELPTGVPDLALRLDGTFRYNLGLRTDGKDDRLSKSPTFTAGENKVAQGGVTTNRLDVLGELDLAYRGRYGLRVSAAGWYDDAYRDGEVRRDPAVTTPGTYVGDTFSTFVRERFRGPYGEVLDAFGWARLDVGDVPVTAKAGRHTVAWGESLFLAGVTHGVAYSQAPLDLAKGFATPGVEAKELYRPLASVSAQAQLAPTFSVAAQLFLEWQPFLFPEGGTFLGGSDAAFVGPDGVYRPPPPPSGSYLANDGMSWPSQTGEWGVALRWRPEVVGATLGLYYRRFTDKFGATLLTQNPGGASPLPPYPSPLRYQQFFGEGIDLLGASAGFQIFGASVGVEASYRRDMPLLAQSPAFAVAPNPALAPLLFPSGAPTLVGNSYQARGDTLHALMNAVGVVSGVPAFSSASWAAEVTYSRWLAVRDNPDMFYAVGYGVCRSDPALASSAPPPAPQYDLARDTGDGCATRDHVALGAGFTPTWFQVFPGVDLLAPLAASYTVLGNSPVAFGGNEGSGTYGAGIAADVRGRTRADLRYVDFFGRIRSNEGRPLWPLSTNGLPAILNARGSVTLTVKVTL